MTSHQSDVWGTPKWLFEAVDSLFNFTLDPAANAENALCVKFFDEKDNGLVQSWEGEIVWCNPPYSDNKAWTAKMATSKAITVVGLIPARTGAKYFHENVFSKASEILFFNRRLKFGDAKGPAPFDSVLILWGEGTLQSLHPELGQLFVLNNS